MSDKLREALIVHEKKVVDMVLSCQGDPTGVNVTSTKVLASREVFLALADSVSPTDAAQLAAVRLLALKENWDSYGAPIISKIALDAALRLRNVLAAVPSFVPMSNGGVQIEWHSLGFDVELEIQPNGRLAHPEDPKP